MRLPGRCLSHEFHPSCLRRIWYFVGGLHTNTGYTGEACLLGYRHENVGFGHNLFRLSQTANSATSCRTITCWSPAPKANDDLAKATFCSEIAKEKNARAFGVRCTGWLCDMLLNGSLRKSYSTMDVPYIAPEYDISSW